MKPTRPYGQGSGGGPPVPQYDQRPMLWATGGIFGVSGALILILDNPLVPLSHEFQLIPLGVGGAVGAAILREKYGPRWIWAYTVFIAWLAFSVVLSQTTFGMVLLAAGLFSLTRAILQTVAEMEG